MSDREEKKSDLCFPDNIQFIDGGKFVVSLTFGISIYTNSLFSSFPDGVLKCFELFLQLCPEDQLRFYRTENMSKHKPVTRRSVGMLATWLKPNAPPRKFIALEIKNGEDYREAPTFKFCILGGEKGSTSLNQGWANLISLSFPAAWGMEKTEKMLALVQEMCSLIPFQSGHAGFSFECSPYAQELSQTHAWRKSMRHPGIDIYTGRKETIAVGMDSIKGVGWLTILSDEFIEKLGGFSFLKQKVGDEAEFIRIPEGIIIKAGSTPGVGDVNRREFLPQYQAVYSAIKPLVEIAIQRAPFLSLDSADEEEKTNAWYRRFDDKS